MDKIDLEQELANTMSSEISRAIDQQIIKSIEIDHLVKQGWYKVTLGYVLFLDTELTSDQVIQWVHDDCGPYVQYEDTFVFKNEQDAAWFKLKWTK